jgi:hypothetical protein
VLRFHPPFSSRSVVTAASVAQSDLLQYGQGHDHFASTLSFGVGVGQIAVATCHTVFAVIVAASYSTKILSIALLKQLLSLPSAPALHRPRHTVELAGPMICQ